jgi:predicted DNA-binding protein (UPF0251 family)
MAGKPNPLVKEALRLMDEDGLNAYTAARKLGLTQSTVYSAFNRRKLKWLEAREAGLCMHCGAPVDKTGKYSPSM